MATTMLLVRIDRHDDDHCQRCKPATEGPGYLLEDSEGVRKFFCEDCTRKLVQVLTPTPLVAVAS
jgi:hypothetical protein